MYSLSVILPPQISAFLFSYEWKRKIKKVTVSSCKSGQNYCNLWENFTRDRKATFAERIFAENLLSLVQQATDENGLNLFCGLNLVPLLHIVMSDIVENPPEMRVGWPVATQPCDFSELFDRAPQASRDFWKRFCPIGYIMKQQRKQAQQHCALWALETIVNN